MADSSLRAVSSPARVTRHGATAILIGLTGNIATGKSAVGQMLAELGARVIDADQVAHEVMRPGGPAYDAVVETFGPQILAGDGTIDRAKLGDIVFRDAAALRRLEAAVHPATIAEVARRIAGATEPVVVVEAIKLIEAGMHRDYDALWVVTAPRSLQIARLVATRGLSEAEAALRVDAQPPQEEKVALADTVIVNDGGLDELREKVEAAWKRVVKQPPRLPLPNLEIRPVHRDDLDDAAGVAEVLNSVIAEGCYTALTGHWTPEAELTFLQSFLGPRSEMFVAEREGRIVGFQCIEPFAAYTSTMDHVAILGTYVRADFRGRGIGGRLAEATFAFARAHGYEKSVIYVLAHNEGGLAYYRGLGFEERGTLQRQTKIDGVYYDEVFMEMHFGAEGSDAPHHASTETPVEALHGMLEDGSSLTGELLAERERERTREARTGE
jgi:dephospho-CoA kinase